MGEKWFQKALRENPHLDKYTIEAIEKLRNDRNITEAVWQGRAYLPYNAGEWDEVVDADPLLKWNPLLGATDPVISRTVRGWVNQRPGLVIQRHPIPGGPNLYGQLRPFKFAELDPSFDLSVYTDLEEDPRIFKSTTHHFHQRIYEHEHTNNGEVRRTPSPIGDKAAARLRSKRDRRLRELDGLPYFLRTRTRTDRGWLKAHVEKTHGASMSPGMIHEHRYGWEDHLVNPDYRQEHEEQDVNSWHGHDEYMKYCYYPRVPSSVIDVHPLALALLEAGGRRVFFALEGLLKNDAILSQGAPVVSAGSVSLWRDPNIEMLFPLLRRFEQVVVVPDSDWFGNDNVWNQARGLAAVLKERVGVDVLVAAPPSNKSCGQGLCTHRTRYIGHGYYLPDDKHKNGVDDWLGSEEGGDLDGMLAVRMDVTDETKEERVQALMKNRIDQFERDNALIRYYIKVATPDGVVRMPTRDVAEDIFGSPGAAMRVSRGNESLVEQELVERIHQDDPDAELTGLGVVPIMVVDMREPPCTVWGLSESLAGRRLSWAIVGRGSRPSGGICSSPGSCRGAGPSRLPRSPSECRAQRHTSGSDASVRKAWMASKGETPLPTDDLTPCQSVRSTGSAELVVA